MHADAIIAIAASKDSQALTREVFGDEIGWLPWKRPGYELGLWLEKFCRENPRRQRRGAREPRPLHLGRRRQGLLRDHARDHQPGDRLAGGEDRRQARLRRRRGTRRSPPEERRRVAARADAGDPRHDLARSVRMVGHFDDQPAVLEFVNAKRHARRWRRSGRAAPTISCAPRSGRWWWTSTRRARPRRDARRAAGGGRGLPRRTMPPTTSAAGMPTARRCATRTRSSTSCRASA